MNRLLPYIFCLVFFSSHSCYAVNDILTSENNLLLLTSTLGVLRTPSFNTPLKIATYLPKDPQIEPKKEVHKLGLFGVNNTLITTLHQPPPFSDPEHSLHYHKIEIKDLNSDGLEDLVLYTKNMDDTLFSQVSVQFMLQSKDIRQWILLDKKIDQNSFKFTDQKHLQVTLPIYAFGNPYDEDDIDMNNDTWRDYYAFTEKDLILINSQYKDFYKATLTKAERNLNNIIKEIKNYEIDLHDMGANQFQLSEYYHQTTLQKTIIAKCKDVL